MVYRTDTIEASEPADAQLARITEYVQHHELAMQNLASAHPELTIAQQTFSHALRREGERALPEVLNAIFDAHRSILLQLKNVINPTGLPLRVTEDGRIKSHEYRSAAVISTDLEGFTEMAFSVPRIGDTNIFDVLSYTYYPHLMEVLRKHDCHLYSFAGDGTLIISREEMGDGGRVLLPALDNAVLCVADAYVILDLVAQVWQQQGIQNPDGTPKRTRFGVKFGPVTMGDALAPDDKPRGMCAKFGELFGVIVPLNAPHYGPPEDFSMRIWGVHGLSIIQNQAARLQSALEDRDHICILMREDVQQLCSPLQKLFDPLGRRALKGVAGDIDIYGMRKVPGTAITELERTCRAYYQEHETYH